MTIQQRITKILSSILVAALCITPEMAAAQQNTDSQSQQPNNSQAQPATQDQQPAQQNRGSRVNPSEPPLQPVTTYPDAPTPQQDQGQNATQPVTTPTTTTTMAQPASPAPKHAQEPVGAAAAQKVPTAGGAASKPAGAAIAPAKQHQTRSLLIKIGAIAAGGIAAGSVYALSRGTSPKPPGAGAAGTTQK